MPQFEVHIVQSTTVTVEADTAESAERIALMAYCSGDTNTGEPQVTDVEEVNS